MAARFLARPQRFLALVELADGEQTLAYCANPGSFHGCLEAGSRCLLWDSGSTARKRRYTWRAIFVKGNWIGTDTHLANELVYLALKNGALPAFTGFHVTRREPRSAKGRRLDFKLVNQAQQCFMEVKSAMVVDGIAARFPDSLSPRANEQLKELTKLARAGHRSVFLFLVQRGDVDRLEVKREADPAFARAVKAATKAGVEFLAVKHSVTSKGFGWPIEIPVAFPDAPKA